MTAFQCLEGEPQGTLIGLFLFIVLINLCCNLDRNLSIGSQITEPARRFKPSTFYAKFMDDITIAESFNIKEPLQSKVYSELMNIKEYSAENLMKLNLKKTNVMVFNKTKKYKFKPECKIEGTEISTLDEIKILGTVLSKDLTWKAITKMIQAKAYRTLWIIRGLLNLI